MIPEPVIPFFEGYFRELEEQGWLGTILHTWEALPARMDSDVDYLVGGVSRADLLGFLGDYCRRKGWLVAQVMEHEPDALYCVCFMAAPPWSAVKLDVAWDYRRKGRLLLSGDFLLAGRRIPAGKAFHVPAPSAEFAYVFAKGLAKSKGAAPVIGRLSELWQADPACCAGVLRMRFGLEDLRPEGSFPADRVAGALEPDNRSFGVWRSRRWGWSQLHWLARRLRRPYGLTIAVGPEVDTRQVGEILLAGFRRFHVVDRDPGTWRRRLMEYRSGLVVGTRELAGQAGVLDLTRESTVDGCVAAALEHLQRVCRPAGEGPEI